MLNATMLNVIMLNAIMLNVMRHNAVMLQVKMLGPLLNVNLLKLVIVLNVGMHDVDLLSFIALMSLC